MGEEGREKLLGVLFARGFFHLKSGEKNKRYNVSIMCKGGGEDILAQFLRQQQITKCILFFFLSFCSSSHLLSQNMLEGRTDGKLSHTVPEEGQLSKNSCSVI